MSTLIFWFWDQNEIRENGIFGSKSLRDDKNDEKQKKLSLKTINEK